MPNLQGASPVDRGEGGYLYAAWTVGGSRAGSGREHSGVTKMNAYGR